MQRKENFLPYFATFFILSFILILSGTSGIYHDVASFFNKAVEPGKNISNILTLKSIKSDYINKITQENLKLKKALSEQKNMLNENTALKSQFESSAEVSQTLLPAKVVGAPGFLPGISEPTHLVINSGGKSGIKKGDAVISNDFLVGKVTEVYPDLSKIELITDEDSTLIAKTETEVNVNGILKGQGTEELVLENVLLTMTLKKDEMVLTRGEVNEKGEGYPPNIPIGKISTIEKKQSDLFQKAVVLSPVDFKNLNTVFVITKGN